MLENILNKCCFF